ncbi:hypothetical protein EON80_17285 [bacterium]|nr:MAG: hypothetical protein EON80_17285 [bacterium]
MLTLEGDDASANITYYWQANLFRSAPTTETLTLRRSTAPNGRRTIWQIVVSPAAVEVAKAPLVPSTPILTYAASQIFTPEPDPVTTQSLQAISRLKQLGLGALMLAMDYDEIYAFYPQYAEKALYPYLKDNDLWKVPGQSSKFSFNASLSGLTLAKLAEPARTVAFYEGEDEKPVFRYAGKAAIGFADGHTVLVSPEELKGVIWKP